VKRWRERRGFALEATEANAEEERFFVGLRLLRGIELEPSDYARFGSTLDRLIADGLLAREGPRIRLTDRGVRLSNEVFAEFID
jgi:oxygen-independent coproporphyrinogen III oxidase